MSNEVYQPLAIELDGCYKKSFSELDAGLQVRVKRAFNPGWDDLTESQRRSIALYHDYGSDPKHEPVLYFELIQLLDTLSSMEIKARHESKDPRALAIVDFKELINLLLKTDRETVGKEIQELRAKVAIDEKPLSGRTENNYLRLIYTLANSIEGFNPKKPHEAAKLIIDATGIESIKQETIANYISKAHALDSKERG